jgi:hypothetical protein
LLCSALLCFARLCSALLCFAPLWFRVCGLRITACDTLHYVRHTVFCYRKKQAPRPRFKNLKQKAS